MSKTDEKWYENPQTLKDSVLAKRVLDFLNEHHGEEVMKACLVHNPEEGDPRTCHVLACANNLLVRSNEREGNTAVQTFAQNEGD